MSASSVLKNPPCVVDTASCLLGASPAMTEHERQKVISELGTTILELSAHLAEQAASHSKVFYAKDGWVYNLGYQCYDLSQVTGQQRIQLQFPFYTPSHCVDPFLSTPCPPSFIPRDALVTVSSTNGGETTEQLVRLNYLELEQLTPKKLSPLFAGNEIEVHMERGAPLSVHSHHFWTQWLAVRSSERDFSRFVATPDVLAVTKELAKEHPSLRITDLGAGDGYLARTLLDDFNLNKYHISSYDLIDSNAYCLAAAENTLEHHVVSEKVTLVEADFRLDNLVRSGCFRPNLILAIDIFTNAVLDDQGDAMALLDKIHKSLVPGGYAIISSYHRPLIKRSDFLARGFLVHNLSKIDCVDGIQYPFYIIQKPPMR